MSISAYVDLEAYETTRSASKNLHKRINGISDMAYSQEPSHSAFLEPYHSAKYNYSLFQTENSSMKPSPETQSDSGPDGYTISIGIALSIVILFTLIGNGLVVTAVASFRRLRSVTNYFVVSLAVADLTVAILVMPYSLLSEVFGEWKFGWIFCYFWTSCDVTCCTASILHLCIISLDRYLAITQPLTYKSRMSRRRAVAMICAVWVCSVAISFLPIYLGWFADPEQMELYVDSPECGLFVNQTYAVISAMTSFYIPLFVMLFTYFKIFRIARKQAKEIKKLEMAMHVTGHELNSKFHKKSKKINRDSKAIKTLGTLMGLFCVSWLPFFLMYIILPFCSTCHVPPIWVSLITWLGYCNSFFNPCVYAFLNRDFRLAFKKILLCGRMNRGNPNSSKICCFTRITRPSTQTTNHNTLQAHDPLQNEPTDYECPHPIHCDKVRDDFREFVELNQNCSLGNIPMNMKVIPNQRTSASATYSGSDRKSVTTLVL